MIRMIRKERLRGFSLAEVIISVGILALVTSVSISAMLFSARLGQSALQDMIAIEALNRESELLRTWPMYSELGINAVRFLGPEQIADLVRDGVDFDETHLVNVPSADPNTDPSGTFGSEVTDPETGEPIIPETGELEIDLASVYDNTVFYDGEFPGNGIVYRMRYQWYGFGWTDAGSGEEDLVMDDPRWDWPEDMDFTGRRIILRGSGNRGGQMANIVDWDGDSGEFEISSQLNGWPRDEWYVTPVGGEYFEVDGGKHVRITMEWGRTLDELNDPNRRKVRVRDIFIPNRPDPGIGVDNS